MLTVIALHRPKNPDELNQEWILVENTGAAPVKTQGCLVTVSPRAQDRPHPVGTLDPGFVLQPKEKIRIVTGAPSKKAQGAPPDEKDAKNYHLCLRESILKKPGLIVRIALGQLELGKATFAPDAKNGVA